jgi:intracellular sulfur oxidation DsrE/DsrF family protein
MKTNRVLIGGLLSLMFCFMTSIAVAAPHKMVIQVNSKDELTQKMAMVNAGNLKTMLGTDNVDVEVVVYGPGIDLLKVDSVFAPRISTLQEKNVRFSVCEGTLKRIKEKTGQEPNLLDGVQRVHTGALRILELQEQGYSYLRP